MKFFYYPCFRKNECSKFFVALSTTTLEQNRVYGSINPSCNLLQTDNIQILFGEKIPTKDHY